MRNARPWRPVNVCATARQDRRRREVTSQCREQHGTALCRRCDPHFGDDGVGVAAVSATSCAAVHSVGGSLGAGRRLSETLPQLFRHPAAHLRPRSSTSTLGGVASSARRAGAAPRRNTSASRKPRSLPSMPSIVPRCGARPVGGRRVGRGASKRCHRPRREERSASRRVLRASRRLSSRPGHQRASPLRHRVRAALRWTTRTRRTRTSAPPSQQARRVRLAVAARRMRRRSARCSLGLRPHAVAC